MRALLRAARERASAEAAAKERRALAAALPTLVDPAPAAAVIARGLSAASAGAPLRMALGTGDGCCFIQEEEGQRLFAPGEPVTDCRWCSISAAMPADPVSIAAVIARRLCALSAGALLTWAAMHVLWGV